MYYPLFIVLLVVFGSWCWPTDPKAPNTGAPMRIGRPLGVPLVIVIDCSLGRNHSTLFQLFVNSITLYAALFPKQA